MTAVVVSYVPKHKYPEVQDIIRDIWHGQESPAWTDLIEAAAVEGGEIAVLVWSHHVSFVAPSRAHQMFVDDCPRLTERAVVGIRALYRGGGISMQELADCYGVALVTVAQAIHRKTWADVP
jgi:hypothetical protein